MKKFGKDFFLLPLNAPGDGGLEFHEALYRSREVCCFEGLKTVEWLTDVFLVQPEIFTDRPFNRRFIHQDILTEARPKALTLVKAGRGVNRQNKRMKLISIETTVGELVRAVPGRARMFENLGIDYCCGGKKPLGEVCRAKGLDPATVVAMLTELEGTQSETSVNPDQMTLSELCDHIEHAHHDWLREELPRLDFMTRKVAAVHGDHELRLHDIRRVFEVFQTEIVSHTQEEEAQVFPAIRKLESAGGNRAEAASALRTAFTKLEAEHEQAGAALEQFAALTDRHTPPEWACNTFRAMFDTLARLERNMHQHVHKENNVLFPRALVLGSAA